MDVHFTLSSIQNPVYQSLAVFLIVQVIKYIPFVNKIPSQLLAVGIAEVLVFLTTTKVPTTVADVVILALNGLLVGIAAIGGWHVIANAMNNIKKT